MKKIKTTDGTIYCKSIETDGDWFVCVRVYKRLWLNDTSQTYYEESLDTRRIKPETVIEVIDTNDTLPTKQEAEKQSMELKLEKLEADINWYEEKVNGLETSRDSYKQQASEFSRELVKLDQENTKLKYELESTLKDIEAMKSKPRSLFGFIKSPQSPLW